ncbi:hypothetical protein [Rhodococcus sp. G-MC3]|uniref:hypothetical protein n=1 Tax=Rhodococcus sp. G-MC3 TaxID=3046209 RepID=UPI0024BB6952|nr:hypothetical protein [Rhodococcus sp. G-MC3]
MSQLDEGFAPPSGCVQWCQLRAHELHLLDDGVVVDLDWWNEHLKRAGHNLRLRGRNLDGKIVTDGMATVQRNDLRIGTELADVEHDSLCLFFSPLPGRAATDTASRYDDFRISTTRTSPPARTRWPRR